MPFLKQAAGALRRNLSDTARHTLSGPHRGWKIALYAALLIVPGGSLAALAGSPGSISGGTAPPATPACGPRRLRSLRRRCSVSPPRTANPCAARDRRARKTAGALLSARVTRGKPTRRAGNTSGPFAP